MARHVIHVILCSLGAQGMSHKEFCCCLTGVAVHGCATAGCRALETRAFALGEGCLVNIVDLLYWPAVGGGFKTVSKCAELTLPRQLARTPAK